MVMVNVNNSSFNYYCKTGYNIIVIEDWPFIDWRKTLFDSLLTYVNFNFIYTLLYSYKTLLTFAPASFKNVNSLNHPKYSYSVSGVSFSPLNFAGVLSFVGRPF